MLKEPILAPGLDGRAIIGGGVGGYGRRCHAVASLDLMVAIPRTVQTTLAFSWARFLVPWSVLWSQCTTTVMPSRSSLHSFVLSLSRTSYRLMAVMASWGCSVGFSTFAPLKLLSSQLTWARNRDGSNRWGRIHSFRRPRKDGLLELFGVVVLCNSSLFSVHSLPLQASPSPANNFCGRSFSRNFSTPAKQQSRVPVRYEYHFGIFVLYIYGWMRWEDRHQDRKSHRSFETCCRGR